MPAKPAAMSALRNGVSHRLDRRFATATESLIRDSTRTLMSNPEKVRSAIHETDQG
jgi:hypothetical protein